MIKHQGVWLPDGEEHFVEWMTKNGELVDGRGTYQIKKLRAVLAECRSFRTAVDVGAHCGLWSMQLVRRFHFVHAFEPVAEYRECWVANMPANGSMEINGDLETFWELHACALGDHDGGVSMMMQDANSSGSTRVGGDGEVPLRRLDDFAIEGVDLIKLDCEGYELFALHGANETIKRWQPTIIVEQKPGRAQRYGLGQTDAVEWLRERGYRLAKELSGDFIMVPQ